LLWTIICYIDVCWVQVFHTFNIYPSSLTHITISILWATLIFNHYDICKTNLPKLSRCLYNVLDIKLHEIIKSCLICTLVIISWFEIFDKWQMTN
jgi:hypothetical protein